MSLCSGSDKFVQILSSVAIEILHLYYIYCDNSSLNQDKLKASENF